jgi:hypothetical protein
MIEAKTYHFHHAAFLPHSPATAHVWTTFSPQMHHNFQPKSLWRTIGISAIAARNSFGTPRLRVPLQSSLKSGDK